MTGSSRGLGAVIARRLARDGFAVAVNGPPGDEQVAAVGFVKSPVLLGRAVLPGMQARRYGRIVQVDSEVARRPPSGRSAYATAKLVIWPTSI